MLPENEILCGDSLEVLRTWPDGCVDMCVTSPPYWGLRDYGVDGQLGLEKTPEEYVAKMVELFAEVKRVLADYGSLWLNLGDSYAASSNQGGTKSIQGTAKRIGAMTTKGHKIPPGLKPKDLCGIPWRVAFALQADGWYLRQDIIWHKPNPMPESCRDRCTKAHEYLFLLTKKPRYYYDQDAVREPAQNRPFDPANKIERDPTGMIMGNSHNYAPGASGYGNHPNGRNRRSVWTIPTQAYSEAHFATFPEKLVEPCIKAGCPKEVCTACGKPRERIVEKEKHFESGSGKSGNPIKGKNGPNCQGGGDTGDIRKGPVIQTTTTGWTDCGCGKGFRPGVVLDPFMGSGTVAQVAARLNRNYVGIELNPEYAEMARKRALQGETGIPVKEQNKGQAPLFS